MLFGIMGLFGIAGILEKGTAASSGQLVMAALAIIWSVHALVVWRWKARPTDRQLVRAAFVLACLGTATAIWGVVEAVDLVKESGLTLGVDGSSVANPRSRRGVWLVRFFPLLALVVTGVSAWLGVGVARETRALLVALARRAGGPRA